MFSMRRWGGSVRVCVNSTDAARCALTWASVGGVGADCDCRSGGRTALALVAFRW
jgi:hypothetical protein